MRAAPGDLQGGVFLGGVYFGMGMNGETLPWKEWSLVKCFGRTHSSF